MQAHGPITLPRSYQGLLHLIILHASERYSVVTHCYYDRHIGCWVLCLGNSFMRSGDRKSIGVSSKSPTHERIQGHCWRNLLIHTGRASFVRTNPRSHQFHEKGKKQKQEKRSKAWTVPPPAPHYFRMVVFVAIGYCYYRVLALHPNILLEGFADGFWGVD